MCARVCVCACVCTLCFTLLTDDFGAFTGASQPPTPISTSLTSSTPSTADDKYAVLASLDDTFRDLKVKEEPPQQPSPVPQPKSQSQPFGVFGNTSVGNPFGAPSGPVQSNPFTGQQQSVGGPQQGFGGQPQQQGQAFGSFGNQQQAMFQQQGIAGQPKQFGGFGQQQMPPGKLTKLCIHS